MKAIKDKDWLVKKHVVEDDDARWPPVAMGYVLAPTEEEARVIACRRYSAKPADIILSIYEPSRHPGKVFGL